MNTLRKRKSYIFDLILIVSLLAVCLSVFLLFYGRDEGAVAAVYIENDKVCEYPLEKDGEFEINGGTNVLKIEDGKAYMLHAKCPDGWCKRQGKIYALGERITCLPNRVMIVIEESGK